MGRLFPVDVDDIPRCKNCCCWKPYVCSQCKTFIASGTDCLVWKSGNLVSGNPAEVAEMITRTEIYPADGEEEIYRVQGTFSKAYAMIMVDKGFKLVRAYCTKCCYHLGWKFLQAGDANRRQPIQAGWYELFLHGEWHPKDAAGNLTNQQ